MVAARGRHGVSCDGCSDTCSGYVPCLPLTTQSLQLFTVSGDQIKGSGDIEVSQRADLREKELDRHAGQPKHAHFNRD